MFDSHTLRDAIIGNVQVLCESAKRLDDELKAGHPEVDWRSVAGMRSVLVHDYFELDLEAIWDIVTRDLPVLKEAVSAIRDDLTGTQA